MSKQARRRSTQRRRMFWKRWKRGEMLPVGPNMSAVLVGPLFTQCIRIIMGTLFVEFHGLTVEGQMVAETIWFPARSASSFDELLMLVGLKRSNFDPWVSGLEYPYRVPANTSRLMTDGEYYGLPSAGEIRTMSEDNEENGICENCTKEFEGSDGGQQCEHCGMDGLGPCCIGQLDHPCEDAVEADDGEEEEDDDDNSDEDEG